MCGEPRSDHENRRRTGPDSPASEDELHRAMFERFRDHRARPTPLAGTGRSTNRDLVSLLFLPAAVVGCASAGGDLHERVHDPRASRGSPGAGWCRRKWERWHFRFRGGRVGPASRVTAAWRDRRRHGQRRRRDVGCHLHGRVFGGTGGCARAGGTAPAAPPARAALAPAPPPRAARAALAPAADIWQRRRGEGGSSATGVLEVALPRDRLAPGRCRLFRDRRRGRLSDAKETELKAFPNAEGYGRFRSAAAAARCRGDEPQRRRPRQPARSRRGDRAADGRVPRRRRDRAEVEAAITSATRT